MLGNSKRSFGHLECVNLSIIDAMGHSSRIKKNVIENRVRRTDREQSEKREQIEIPITEATIIIDNHQVEPANKDEFNGGLSK